MPPEPCKICGASSDQVFVRKILNKHDVAFFRCGTCGFMQTEKPYWLPEAYASAITALDLGLTSRNFGNAARVEKIIRRYFNAKARFLDYAGGYGMFTRIMRDRGFDFYHDDKYCENIFARWFTAADLPESARRYEIITCFEVFEHSEDPMAILRELFSQTHTVLLSTELIPERDVEQWWYLGTSHGQHIAFYTVESLRMLADRFGKQLHTADNLHLLTDRPGVRPCWKESRLERLVRRVRERIWRPLPSRLGADMETVTRLIASDQRAEARRETP